MRVGLGFRAELAADLVAAPEAVDFVEIVAETCYTQAAARREALALRERWPVIPHGVKLSLGSADGVDLDRARRLGALARELRAPMISEHVSFTRAGGTEIGHLTQLPRSRDAVRVVAANVERVRRVLPDVPFLLENVAWSVLWPDDEMDEPSFYHEVVAATGCDLLLDAGNLYANAVNEGLDPVDVLSRYPLDRVAMIHVAGGVWEHGFYFDTHAHAVPPVVMDLVARVVAMRDVPVLIERDADIVFGPLADELAVLRAMPRGPVPRAVRRSDSPVRAPDSTVRGPDSTVRGPDSTLAALQVDLARLLAAPRGPAIRIEPSNDRIEPGTSPADFIQQTIDSRGDLAARLDHGQLVRARGILQRKRVDDAMPLLAYLSRDARIRDIAIAALDGTARPERTAGPLDAWEIANAALAVPELADVAAMDRLLLRARFAGLPATEPHTTAVRPRRGPFIGFARLASGKRIRATKGIGALATVLLHM